MTKIIEWVLLPFRLVQTIMCFLFLYIFAGDFFYRLSPRLYEQCGIKCFKVFINFLGIKIIYHYRNQRPLPEKAIYICNHSSSFELFIITSLLRNTHYVIDAQSLKIPVLNKILRKGPLIMVERHSARSRADCIKQIGEKTKLGRNVMLFPEGYSHKFLANRFATGAFRASVDNRVPIVPIYLHYENLNAFVPDEKVDHKKEFFRILAARNKTIHAYFFDPIEPDAFATAEIFRDHVYGRYRDWQYEFYGQK